MSAEWDRQYAYNYDLGDEHPVYTLQNYILWAGEQVEPTEICAYLPWVRLNLVDYARQHHLANA